MAKQKEFTVEFRVCLEDQDPNPNWANIQPIHLKTVFANNGAEAISKCFVDADRILDLYFVTKVMLSIDNKCYFLSKPRVVTK